MVRIDCGDSAGEPILIGTESLKRPLNLLSTGHPDKPKTEPDETMCVVILSEDVPLKVFIIGKDECSFLPCQAEQSNIIKLAVNIGYPEYVMPLCAQAINDPPINVHICQQLHDIARSLSSEEPGGLAASRAAYSIAAVMSSGVRNG
jgi:hypothetical protein